MDHNVKKSNLFCTCNKTKSTKSLLMWCVYHGCSYELWDMKLVVMAIKGKL